MSIHKLENIYRPFFLGIHWPSRNSPWPRTRATLEDFKRFITYHAIGFCHEFATLSDDSFGMWLAYFSHTKAMLVEVSESPRYFYLGCTHEDIEVEDGNRCSVHSCPICNIRWKMKNAPR